MFRVHLCRCFLREEERKKNYKYFMLKETIIIEIPKVLKKNVNRNI